MSQPAREQEADAINKSWRDQFDLLSKERDELKAALSAAAEVGRDNQLVEHAAYITGKVEMKERCAQVAETYFPFGKVNGKEIAAAIRAMKD